jgi:hypothetical protein
MSNYIDADKLKKLIDKKWKELADKNVKAGGGVWDIEISTYLSVLGLIESLEQERPEMDLEKLGEIARHLIAVKDHEEDMRLDEGEWLLLERIGYPEKFNARKEE